MIKITSDTIIFFDDCKEKISEKYNSIYNYLNTIADAINGKNIANSEKISANVALVELLHFVEQEWQERIINRIRIIAEEYENIKK